MAPKSWEDNGGQGSIAPFPSGVWVDAQGMMRPLLKEAKDRGPGRPAGRQRPAVGAGRCPPELDAADGLAARGWKSRSSSAWPRASRRSETMQVLAGLQRIRYVFVYPESGDLVLAGPAGDWTIGPEELDRVDGDGPAGRAARRPGGRASVTCWAAPTPSSAA